MNYHQLNDHGSRLVPWAVGILIATLVTLVAVAIASTQSCQSVPLIPTIKTASVLGSVRDVVGRHDLYVIEDVSLTQEEQAQDLEESSELLSLLASSSSVPLTTFHTIGDPVFERHNDYVLRDASLSQLEQSVYTRSAHLLLYLGKESLPPEPVQRILTTNEAGK